MTTEEIITLHCKTYQDGGLPIYTVTHGVSDYPGKYVVRMHVVAKGGRDEIGPVIAIEDSLEAVREAIAPLGLFCSPRVPQDLPVIVESWF